MSPLATTLKTNLEAEAKQFHDVVDHHMDVPWPDFLRAWGELREIDILKRDDEGAYYIEKI
ncbi:MAG: hypothetical protein GKS01_15090 [Alphaproteobacteria bacterium]|nr:hypothetical protein [Alphaproteobacteria bacterium]